MTENKDTFEECLRAFAQVYEEQKKAASGLTDVNLGDMLMEALDLPPKQDSSLGHATGIFNGLLHCLSLTGSPAHEVLKDKSWSDLKKCAMDLHALHEVLASHYNAGLCAGVDLYANQARLLNSYYRMPFNEGMSKEEQDLLQAGVKALSIPWKMYFVDIFESLFGERSPLKPSSDTLKLNLHYGDEKAYNEQQVEENHFIQERIGTVPAVSSATQMRETLSAVKNDHEEMQRIAEMTNVSVEELCEKMNTNVFEIHGFTGYIFLALGPLSAPSVSSDGLLFRTYTHEKTRALYVEAAQRLGWETRRLEERLAVVSAQAATFVAQMKAHITKGSSYYRRSVLQRVLHFSTDVDFPGRPDVPWKIISALDPFGNPFIPNEEAVEEARTAIAGLPIVVKDEPSAEDVAGRLWFDTESNQWVIFWGALTNTPLFCILHHPHEDCPFGIERFTTEEFMEHWKKDTWHIV